MVTRTEQEAKQDIKISPRLVTVSPIALSQHFVDLLPPMLGAIESEWRRLHLGNPAIHVNPELRSLMKQSHITLGTIFELSDTVWTGRVR